MWIIPLFLCILCIMLFFSLSLWRIKQKKHFTMKKLLQLSALLFAANFIFTSCRCIEIELFAASITLNRSALVLTVGQTETLIATVLPENAVNKDVTWKSDDESIAVVDNNGTVTAISLGAAIVTVTTTDGELTAAATVTVVPIPVTGVTLNRNTLELDVGETEMLIASVIPINATNQAVMWSSSNASVAAVNNNGVVTALSEGTAAITVTTVDGSRTASCVVNVTYVPEYGVIIGGIRWATRNVAAPGTFAPRPESPGMFFQWNRRTGWSAATPGVGVAVVGWNSTTAGGTAWYAANDPCPAGWRVPTQAEIANLRNQPNVWMEDWNDTGVNGRLFGLAPYQIFLPAVGWRLTTGTLNYVGMGGLYWSSTQSGSTNAMTLWFSSGNSSMLIWSRANGLSVRCVAE